MQSTVSQDRDKYIGGSDIPIIMGISPFKTRYQLLLEKAKIQECEFGGNKYTEYGNIMEEKIRDYINQLKDMNFVEDKLINGNIRCHTDGYDKDGQMILEIKTTSDIHNELFEYKTYLVQLLFYMMNYKIEKGMLAVYNRPEDFNEEFDETRLQIFTFTINQFSGLCDDINKEVEKFLIDLEKVKENPLISEEDLLPTDIKELSEQVIVLENRLKAYKEIEKQSKAIKEKLYQAMQEAGIKKWETPNGTKITLVEGGEDELVKVFNEDKFKEEQPVIYASYTEEKLKKGKSGYIKITVAKDDK